jgi:hypothetical protein
MQFPALIEELKWTDCPLSSVPLPERNKMGTAPDFISSRNVYSIIIQDSSFFGDLKGGDLISWFCLD